MVNARILPGLAALLAMSTASGCPLLAGPELLLDDVNAKLIVLDVDEQRSVAVDVAGELRRSEPREERGNVELDFVLDVGVHEGTVVIVRDDQGGEPDRCGTFSFDVTAGAVDVVVVDAGDLARCDDDGEGEGDEGEGDEGEGDEGEGEGEGEGDEGEGEGDDECVTVIERFDDGELADGLELRIEGDASALFDGAFRLTALGDDDEAEGRIEYAWDGASVRASVVVLDATAPAALSLHGASDRAASLVVRDGVVTAALRDDSGGGDVVVALALPAVLSLRLDADGVITWEAGPLGALDVVRTAEADDFGRSHVSVGFDDGTLDGGSAAFDDLLIEDGCAL